MKEGEKPSNKQKCLLKRGIQNYAQMKAAGQNVDDFFDGGRDGRKRKSNAATQVAPRRLTCMRGLRGPATKCPALKEALWDWFVAMRSSVKTSMTARYLCSKAKSLADTLVVEMAKTGEFIDFPSIDLRWCMRWRKEYGVVLLQPNRRYKVSWALAAERCKYMWMNNFRVRYMAKLYLGKDLSERIFGIDEKPIHFNESASKAVKTLHYEGAPFVVLRTNHSASRDRLSLMTMVTSWRALCRCVMKPPIALCVRAKSAQKLASVVLPHRFRISLDWSLSGSYDKVRFYAYLDTWLEEWTGARAASRDYRLLYLDVAKGHLGADVEEYCWQRGYIYLLHYGGTTGITQVNDTHCHLYVEDFYVELEQENFTKKQTDDPGNIDRPLPEVVADVVTTWRSVDHERSCDGHWATGLANSLDVGDQEDRLISGEAREVWDAMKMTAERPKAFKEVDDMIAAGTIKGFEDVHKVIFHPPSTGEYKEGEEFEGRLSLKGEKWEQAADIALKLRDLEDEFEDSATCTTALVEFVPATTSSNGPRATASRKSCRISGGCGRNPRNMVWPPLVSNSPAQ